MHFIIRHIYVKMYLPVSRVIYYLSILHFIYIATHTNIPTTAGTGRDNEIDAQPHRDHHSTPTVHRKRC